MRWTVVYTRAALNRLTEIWLHAPDRQAVTAAADAIEGELLIDADTKGVPYPGGRRLLRIPPLAVLFRVDPGDCKVTVLQVARIP
jgi:plasmid stabilization system protein ParE